MSRRHVRLILTLLLLASAGVSLGACESRWHHFRNGVRDIF